MIYKIKSEAEIRILYKNNNLLWRWSYSNPINDPTSFAWIIDYKYIEQSIKDWHRKGNPYLWVINLSYHDLMSMYNDL